MTKEKQASRYEAYIPALMAVDLVFHVPPEHTRAKMVDRPMVLSQVHQEDPHLTGLQPYSYDHSTHTHVSLMTERSMQGRYRFCTHAIVNCNLARWAGHQTFLL